MFQFRLSKLEVFFSESHTLRGLIQLLRIYTKVRRSGINNRLFMLRYILTSLFEDVLGAVFV
jgi:hypothetical protein